MSSAEEKNNWGLNISQLLNTKYQNWQKKYPEIVELDNDLNVVRIWKSKKDICQEYNIHHIQALDISLRKCVRTKGKFFLVKKLYDMGLRPIPSQKRNEKIYAYNPSEEILERFNNYEPLTQADIDKDIKNFSLIACFENSVACSTYLDLSITNVRIVAKKKDLFYKDYYFSFTPLISIQAKYTKLVELLKKSENSIGGVLSKEDIEEGNACIKEILDKEPMYIRAKGFMEQKIYRIINRNSSFEYFLKNYRDEKEEYIEE